MPSLLLGIWNKRPCLTFHLSSILVVDPQFQLFAGTQSQLFLCLGESTQYLGTYDAYKVCHFGYPRSSSMGKSCRYPKSRVLETMNVRSDTSHVTCAIEAHTMTLTNHEQPPAAILRWPLPKIVSLLFALVDQQM